ncbi:SubName: Full=Uncharacterized protein {ECO:0000313/EMBL:CCA75554.1}; Flags: Fragment [Serendipita indica DSM 11827]|nr:SubName: Full=Uncharacterized protein {ECO:0000313/EMBL:CCA75554.1}; Flags: Fragment [Serendipita indica DSM 11827]
MSANDLIRSQPLSDPKFDLPVEFLEQQLRDTLISSEQESTSTFISTPEQVPPLEERTFPNCDIPTEIWLAIFRYAIDAMIQDYINEPLRLKQFLFPPPNHALTREADTVTYARNRAQSTLAQSSTATNQKPITLLLDVSERFDSKESELRYLRDRQRSRLAEPGRNLDGRELLLFPEGGYDVHLFLRPANLQMKRPTWRVHPKAPTEIRHVVRIGGKHSPKPTSLTIHWPRRSRFSAQIHSLIRSYQPQHLTLVDNFPDWEDFRVPGIKSIRLKTTETQRHIALEWMILPFLQELYVHSCRLDISAYFPSNLPTPLTRLRVLGITPVHVSFLTRIDFPCLETVIFYPPNIKPRARRLGEEWTTTLAGVIKSITALEFEGWPAKYQRNVVYHSIVPLCLALLHQLPHLQRVTFRQSFVWAEGLVERLPATLGLKVGAQLEELVLDECIGVTQAHCDALAAVVSKIKVF